MQTAFFRWVEQLVGGLSADRSTQSIAESPDVDMLDQVQQARREWENAQRYFECVSDPELVDHAILLREAAQKKYMYLLRLAKSEGLRAFEPEPCAEAVPSAGLVLPENGSLPNPGCE